MSGIRFVPNVVPDCGHRLTASDVNDAVAIAVLHTVFIAGVSVSLDDSVVDDADASATDGGPLTVDTTAARGGRGRRRRVDSDGAAAGDGEGTDNAFVKGLVKRLGCEPALAVAMAATDLLQTASPRDLMSGPMTLR